jgi:hypothetical protein
VVAAAGSEAHFPQLEVGEELVPFLGCEVAVFLAWALGSAAGDERPVVRDHVLGVDRCVSHRRVHSGVAADPAMCGGRPERMASVTKILV